MKYLRMLVGVLIACLLGACQLDGISTPVPTSGARISPIPTNPSGIGTAVKPQATEKTQLTPVGSPILNLWVPPQFNPNSTKPAGELLKNQLDSFKQANPGVEVRVRVKPVSGPGGLLESLIAASAAAPDSLPDLIALPQEYLEAAALKGLITPLDGLSSQIDDPDWYEYARQLGVVQGSSFGLPFAADALVIAYRPAQVSKVPTDWESITSVPTPLAFPGNDPAALFPMGLLISNGDTLQDTEGRPVLQEESLRMVLMAIQDAGRKGVFPTWTYQYKEDAQVWAAYRDNKVMAAITWISHFLTERPPDTSIVPVPSINAGAVSLASGWCWAVSTPHANRKASSVRLAEDLSSSEFLAKFSLASGYLPTRPSALAAWNDRSLQAMVSQVELAARAQPNYYLTGSLGAAVRDAVLQVLKDEVDPSQAAINAIQELKGP
jgi:ABC-type glycerol-3-phosphate transport system substrate-binding protein